MIQEATIAFQKDSNLFVDAVQPSTLCGAVLRTLITCCQRVLPMPDPPCRHYKMLRPIARMWNAAIEEG
jgi:hypothetical protein